MIEFGHLTHVGLRRELNEDTYYGDSELGLWLVADGMGGHEFGEVASALARETIVREIRDGTPLAQAIRIADEEIIRTSRRRNDACRWAPRSSPRACSGNRFEVAWVGDSRVYLWRTASWRQLSQDHSYVQELIAQGAITAEQARSHPHRNVVTQALGVTDPRNLNVETMTGELRPGMQLLLCSDGLTEEVDDRSIAAACSAHDDCSAQECVDALVAAALDGGGSDNVTVVLVRTALARARPAALRPPTASAAQPAAPLPAVASQHPRRPPGLLAHLRQARLVRGQVVRRRPRTRGRGAAGGDRNSAASRATAAVPAPARSRSRPGPTVSAGRPRPATGRRAARRAAGDGRCPRRAGGTARRASCAGRGSAGAPAAAYPRRAQRSRMRAVAARPSSAQFVVEEADVEGGVVDDQLGAVDEGEELVDDLREPRLVGEELQRQAGDFLRARLELAVRD